MATRVCLKELQLDLQEKDELIRELSCAVNPLKEVPPSSTGSDVASTNVSHVGGAPLTPRQETGSIAARVTAAATALALKTLRRTPTIETRVTPRKSGIGTNITIKGKAKIIAKPHNGAVMALDIINLTDYISGGSDGYLAVLESSLLSVKYSFRASPRATQLLFLSCYEDLIAIVCDNCCVYIGDINRRKMFIGLRGHQVKITGCAFITRTLLITSSLDQTIRIWSLDTACCLIVLHCDSPVSCLGIARGCHYAPSNSTPKSSVTFSHTVVTGHRDGRVLIWKVSETGTKIRKVSSIQPLIISQPKASDPTLHDAQVTAVTFFEQRDDTLKQLIISAGMDGRLLISDPRAGVQLSHLLVPGFLQPITALVAGANICCGLGENGAICVWNMRDQQQYSVLEWPSQCTAILLDKKNDNLITGHADGSIALSGQLGVGSGPVCQGGPGQTS